MKTRLTLVAAATLLAAANANAAGPTAAGTLITNQASATYNDSTGTKTVQSNIVTTTVQQVASLTINNGSAKSGAVGTKVVFAHSVTNTGNGPDTFALSQTNTGAMTLSGIEFFLDENGDGAADNATPITVTPQLAAGATYRFVAVATVAAGATGSTNTLTVKATSGFNGSVNATSTDIATVGAGAAIDLTAGSFGPTAPGHGLGPEQAAQETKLTTAGTMTSFVIYLNNGGGSQETFALAASTDVNFGGSPLPAGWTVVFKDASGQVITNATVAAGANVKVTAEVTPAAGATPGTTDIWFRAQSTTNPAISDRIHEAVTVVAGDSLLELVKTQGLDDDCNGTVEGEYTKDPITAKPGACIRYKIVATNKGLTTINAVVINDNVPANTTYHAGAAANTLLGSILAPVTSGLVTTVSATGFNLDPGKSNTLDFGVKINP